MLAQEGTETLSARMFEAFRTRGIGLPRGRGVRGVLVDWVGNQRV
jgi:hypothetical protein